MKFDVVVIGAGPSGLAAAARLAHFGVRVCVLEAHRRLGGLSSWHHVNGKEISSGLHAFTNYNADGRGGPLGKLLRQLRLKPADLALRSQGFSSIRFPSATLRFSNRTDQIREEIARVFPGQIDKFDAFRRLVNATDEGELTRTQQSARAILDQYITDPLLADMLLCPVMFYGNPGGVGDGDDASRSQPDMDWLLFCVVWKCIFESGFGYPACGMRALWELLADRIKNDGGDIRMGAKVVELRRAGDTVTEAVLANGETVQATVFLSSAGGVETETLIHPGQPAEKEAGTISITEGISMMDCSAVEAGMEETVIFYSFTDKFTFRRPDGLVEDSNGVVCAPGNYQPPDAEEKYLKITQLASYPVWRALSKEAYAYAKNDVAAGMAAALGKLGIVPAKNRGATSKFGIFDDVFTPLTLERYTGHTDGALYGSPVKSRTGETGWANVFLIGADQGFHGIVGAMLSGVAMANMHWLSSHA